ncbi:MAG: hypothetical protein L3K06_04165 [Thermoplasmata archaeon]|nr:hypothetical protein [Thermoplasmata archaeon]
MDRTSERLPLWVLLAGLGGATLVGEVALYTTGYGAYALAVLPVTVGVGLVYLFWKAPASRAPDTDDEPFDDPVVEALRPPEAAEPPMPAEKAPLDGAVAPVPSGPADDVERSTAP